MANSIVSFEFESQDIRFVDGKPVANDVASVLGYADPQSTISKKVCSENKGVAKMVTPGGIQSVTVLEEAGIYQLIFSSKLESAKRFQQWVFSEVLPTIRQTGSYSIQPQQPKLPSRQLALETAKAVAEIQDLISDNNPRLAQFLIDHAISDIMPSGNALTGAKLKGVVEIAEDMGYPVTLANRSQLGKFVKARCGDLAQQEERLVNGQARTVACYPSDSKEIKQAITDFFTR